MTIEFLIFFSVILGVGSGLLFERYRARMEPAGPAGADFGSRSGTSNALQRVAPVPNLPSFDGQMVPAWFDGAAQLRLVSDARFASRRLL